MLARSSIGTKRIGRFGGAVEWVGQCVPVFRGTRTGSTAAIEALDTTGPIAHSLPSPQPVPVGQTCARLIRRTGESVGPWAVLFKLEPKKARREPFCREFTTRFDFPNPPF